LNLSHDILNLSSENAYREVDVYRPYFGAFASVTQSGVPAGALSVDIHTRSPVRDPSYQLGDTARLRRILRYFGDDFSRVDFYWSYELQLSNNDANTGVRLLEQIPEHRRIDLDRNLSIRNSLTARGVPLNEAVWQTSMGLLKEFGCERVTIEQLQGEPGNYQAIQGYFERTGPPKLSCSQPQASASMTARMLTDPETDLLAVGSEIVQSLGIISAKLEPIKVAGQLSSIAVTADDILQMHSRTLASSNNALPSSV
jgi:hypothetical protein